MRNNRGGNQTRTAPYQERGCEGLGGLSGIDVTNLCHE